MIRMSRHIEQKNLTPQSERERVYAHIPTYIIQSLRSQPEYNFFVLSFKGCSNPAHFERMVRRDFETLMRDVTENNLTPEGLVKELYFKILSQRNSGVDSIAYQFSQITGKHSQALAYEMLEKKSRVKPYPVSKVEKYNSPNFNSDRFTYLFLVLSAACSEAARLISETGSFGQFLPDYTATVHARWSVAEGKRDTTFAWNEVTRSVTRDLQKAHRWSVEAMHSQHHHYETTAELVAEEDLLDHPETR